MQFAFNKDASKIFRYTIYVPNCTVCKLANINAANLRAPECWTRILPRNSRLAALRQSKKKTNQPSRTAPQRRRLRTLQLQTFKEHRYSCFSCCQWRMPSSVSAKPEKQQPTTAVPSSVATASSSTPAAAAAAIPPPNAENAQPPVDNSSPIRQVLVIIEHKIRNLEKRKVSPPHTYTHTQMQVYCVYRHYTHLHTNRCTHTHSNAKTDFVPLKLQGDFLVRPWASRLHFERHPKRFLSALSHFPFRKKCCNGIMWVSRFASFSLIYFSFTKSEETRRRTPCFYHCQKSRSQKMLLCCAVCVSLCFALLICETTTCALFTSQLPRCCRAPLQQSKRDASEWEYERIRLESASDKFDTFDPIWMVKNVFLNRVFNFKI